MKKSYLYWIFMATAVLAYACGSKDNKTTSGTAAGNKPENAKHIAIVDDLTKKLQLKPDSVGLRLQLAAVLDSVGDYKTALQHIDTLIMRDSLNYGLWFQKGQVMQDARDTSGAILMFKRAIRIYPSTDALLSLANLYAETKNKDAVAICARIRDLQQGREMDAHCAFITGVYYARTGDAAQALKYFDECVANNYTYMVAYIEKGLIYFDQKNYTEALKIFQFASRVNNLYADAYYYQARAYEMMNQKDSAVLRYKQALSLDKTIAEAHNGLKRLGEEK
ncbi:MAG: tetratricopeptide repeat protein [Filimonas sp.]|nr:tetratricopeptide repeat protein [Filimonas sp.]